MWMKLLNLARRCPYKSSWDSNPKTALTSAMNTIFDLDFAFLLSDTLQLSVCSIINDLHKRTFTELARFYCWKNRFVWQGGFEPPPWPLLSACSPTSRLELGTRCLCAFTYFAIVTLFLSGWVESNHHVTNYPFYSLSGRGDTARNCGFAFHSANSNFI